MTTAWDKYQELVRAELRKVFSETVADHATMPRNVGTIDNPEGYAQITGPCGDTMEFWLRIRNEIIQEITFLTDGCTTTIAAGSITTELVKKRKVNDAIGISQESILKALGGLPEDSQHCALLASNTLRAAIRDYYAYKQEPWKRAYRR